VGLLKVIVRTSPGESEGTTGGGLDASAETIPGQHAIDPAVLFSNLAQELQVPTLAACVAFEYVFAGHALQLDNENACGCALYVPAGHAVTSPPKQ
jgi:hypothetical protein